MTSDAALSASAEEITAAIRGLYAAFLAGDRAAFDAHLACDVTTWETHLPGPLRTRSDLDAYRDDRDAAGQRPRLRRLEVLQLRVDVWGAIGVARYVLHAEPEGPAGETEECRVTDVFRRVAGRWVIAHHHSERVRP